MKNILNHIESSHFFIRFFCLSVGCFVYTFIYHKFLVPSNFVTGGVSGLAILIQEVFKLDTTTFINLTNIILVVLSFIVLGKKKTFDQLIGTILYLIMLNVTEPIAKSIDFVFQSQMLMIITISIMIGLANGLIYRPGFSTGGSDYLSLMISEKFKIPMPHVSLVINIVVICFGAFVFSIPTVMASVFIIYVSNRIMNAFLFGVSTSKMVYIVSLKHDEIKDFIIRGIKTGVTEMKVSGGLFSKNKQMLMCVVHNAQYTSFKEKILSIDDKAFILSNNCYEVSGGQKFNILPF